MIIDSLKDFLVESQLSGPVHKYGDAPKPSRHPARKARGGRNPLSYLTDE